MCGCSTCTRKEHYGMPGAPARSPCSSLLENMKAAIISLMDAGVTGQYLSPSVFRIFTKISVHRKGLPKSLSTNLDDDHPLSTISFGEGGAWFYKESPKGNTNGSYCCMHQAVTSVLADVLIIIHCQCPPPRPSTTLK